MIKNLEELLIREGKVSGQQLEKVKSKSREEAKPLTTLLLESGLIQESEILEFMAKALEIPYKTLAHLEDFTPPLLKEPIPLNYMRENRFIPLHLEERVLTISMADPLNYSLLDELREMTGLEILPTICPEKEITVAIERFYGAGSSSMAGIIDDLSKEEIEMIDDGSDNVEHLKDLASEAPVIKLVNLIISKAIENGASDIHIEPFEGDLAIRYRIDGVLHKDESPPKRLQAALISRLKIMAKLNIAERRLPQDGKIRFNSVGKSLDMRVSTLPTVYGESVVLRILDSSGSRQKLEEMGFPRGERSLFESLICKPYGMLLVTGPTGSGKTTTLYGAMGYINKPGIKIVTIEDPVEYQMDGINQIHVKPQIGLTFSTGLRSIVRQDPDVIMVGEIRDGETADIAIQSALTGHMVFSTVHTNDAAGAVTRLQDMGVESFLISSALVGVLAQRLVRVVCPKCRAEETCSEGVLKKLGIQEWGEVKVWRGKGCAHCNHTGYKGRQGIFELLVVNEEIRELILKKTSASVIKEKARKLGMRTLREEGWDKVKRGITSPEEVLRVTVEEAV